MGNGIALPKHEHCQDSASIVKQKNLPLKEFMARYGNDKLALYNIPTDAELEQLNEYDEENEEMSEDEDGSDNEDD